ncbi:MAG: nucleoside hydrolase [Anaerolineales bacterium]|nr:nucleoside hydrolase [Anaerolineales bacterium]
MPHSVNSPAHQTPPQKNIIIDTDLSFDDYVAIVYLLEHPDVNVRAITVADGVAHIQPGLENCARLLALAGQANVPIGKGASLLSNQNDFPPFWRFLMDYAIRILLPKRRTPAHYQDAPNLIREQILASPTPVTLVALAPLTNLALALQSDPTLVNQIEAIYISGGAFTVPGVIHTDIPSNPNTVSEWNFYTDPLAAKVVIESGAQIFLVPLDATHLQGSSPLAFSHSAIQTLTKAPAPSHVWRVLTRLLRSWQSKMKRASVVPVWDAAVAALVTNPNLGSWRELKVSVALEPQAKAGQTYEDPNAPHSIRVCFGGDRAAFEAAFLELAKNNQRAN